jgi:hypothetical protein
LLLITLIFKGGFLRFFLKKISSILIVFTFLLSFLFASIQTIDSASDLKPILDKADNDTLVIFDIDHTIFLPISPCHKILNVKGKKHLLNDLKLKHDINQIHIALNLIALSDTVLFTPEIKECIELLQRKKIHVIACTNILTGDFLPHKDAMQRRIEQLQILGIDFSKTAPFTSDITFDNMKPYLGRYPEAKNGVICTNGDKNTKAEIIIEYFEHFKHLWKPRKIIFIDDTKSHIEHMEKRCEKTNISVTCIHYIEKVKENKVIKDEGFMALWTTLAQQANIILKKRLEEKSFSMFENLLEEN